MILLYRAMLKRHVIELRRYPLDTVGYLVATYLLFLFLFLGVNAFNVGTVGEGTLPNVIVGFVLWTLVASAYSTMSSGLLTEAQVGTLEQLAMSKFGLLRVLLTSHAALLTIQILQTMILLVAAMATSGRWFHLDALSLLPILIATLIGVEGIGLAVGGLALRHKRVASIISLIQLVFIGLVAAPVADAPLLKLFPLANGSSLIRGVMVDSESLLSLPTYDVVVLLASSLVFVVAGMAIFRRYEIASRRRGLLGQY